MLFVSLLKSLKIYSHKPKQPDHAFLNSLNTIERLREIEKINLENSKIYQILNKSHSTLDIQKMNNDFMQHKEIGYSMQRKVFGVTLKTLSPLPSPLHGRGPRSASSCRESTITSWHSSSRKGFKTRGPLNDTSMCSSLDSLQIPIDHFPDSAEIEHPLSYP